MLDRLGIEGEPPYPGGGADVAQHVSDYRAFVRIVRLSVAASAVVLALLAYFLL